MNDHDKFLAKLRADVRRLYNLRVIKTRPESATEIFGEYYLVDANVKSKIADTHINLYSLDKQVMMQGYYEKNNFAELCKRIRERFGLTLKRSTNNELVKQTGRYWLANLDGEPVKTHLPFNRLMAQFFPENPNPEGLDRYRHDFQDH